MLAEGVLDGGVVCQALVKGGEVQVEVGVVGVVTGLVEVGEEGMVQVKAIGEVEMMFMEGVEEVVDVVEEEGQWIPLDQMALLCCV